jgi:hypothetical protein
VFPVREDEDMAARLGVPVGVRARCTTLVSELWLVGRLYMFVVQGRHRASRFWCMGGPRRSHPSGLVICILSPLGEGSWGCSV